MSEKTLSRRSIVGALVGSAASVALSTTAIAAEKKTQTKTETIKALMKDFEKCINTADRPLMDRLVSPKAPFLTPASPTPLYGAEGYMSIVLWMRKSFPDVQWIIEDIVVEGNTAAVSWNLTGTHTGEAFFDIATTNKKFQARVMNFYYFDDQLQIVKDVAADGMIAIFRGLQN